MLDFIQQVCQANTRQLHHMSAIISLMVNKLQKKFANLIGQIKTKKVHSQSYLAVNKLQTLSRCCTACYITLKINLTSIKNV